ncbi:transcriptional regulator [Sphingomonas oleivorans]|uniref:Transcriptional regulator n=1 Tax=Sphingomonas oleivorans TaxID=1735121 RepID=A0A2T5FYW8_9SPHN|nr:FMN-binding negative transcriptional regulator [Sphingomonas oleivorans]PTQ11800.1 transcriptional regulator [Sphingomonas oleivorans]
MPGSLFEHYSDADVVDLIHDYPLAWVSAGDGDARHASLLPLLVEQDGDRRVARLLGHMARSNPLYATLTANPRALILFQGPQGYVSPGLVSDRSWVPTWNFAQLRIEAEVRFEPEGGDAALAALVEAMEAGRPEPWHVEESGARYRGMERAIIAFRAEVRVVRGRFKLGQDERPEILAEILRNHPDPALTAWMRRFNPGRCPSEASAA